MLRSARFLTSKVFSNYLSKPRFCSTMSEEDKTKRNGRLIWFDGEMTGLGSEDKLVEVACVITEADLTVSMIYYNITPNV